MAKRKRKKSNQKSKNSPEETLDQTANASDNTLDATAMVSQELDVEQDVASTTQASSQETEQRKKTTAGPGAFLQGTKEELEKVVWPDRQQLISESAAVILMVSLSAIIISLVDNLFGWISQLVF